jgi:hypothetical protein
MCADTLRNTFRLLNERRNHFVAWIQQAGRKKVWQRSGRSTIADFGSV